MAHPFQSPDDAGQEPEQAAMPYTGQAAVDDSPTSAVGAARERNENRLLAIPGVKGLGVTRNAIGDDAIVVYVVDASVASRLPSQVEGYPVETVVTGEIDAYGLQ